MEEENSVDMQLIKYIVASRSFLLYNQYEAAYKILDKAEILAKEHLLFPILNECVAFLASNASVPTNF